MAKNIAEQITQQLTDLQKENEKLRNYEKLFEKFLKSEYGMSKKELESKLDFAEKITSRYGLKSESDRETFREFIFHDTNLAYKFSHYIEAAAKQG